MHGQLSHELEVGVQASEAWQIYSTLELARLVRERLSNVVEKVQLIEGDGGVGTVFQLTFPPGMPRPRSYRERFTKIDNEKRVKEVQVIEGGFLDIGYRHYGIRFEMVEKGIDASIIRSTIQYEIEEAFVANESLVSIDILAMVAEVVAKYLTEKKANVTVA